MQIDLTEQSRLIENSLNRALLHKNVFLLLKATRQRSDVSQVSATSWRYNQGIEIKMVWGTPRASARECVYVIIGRKTRVGRQSACFLPQICWWHPHCNPTYLQLRISLTPSTRPIDSAVSFIMETEKDGMLPFLGKELLNRAPQIETKLYVKPTNTGLLLHYHSHVDNHYKQSLLRTML